MTTKIVKLNPVAKCLGAILLISGTTIGGGMLGLPLATAPTGYVPSISLLIVTWLAMTMTAFLFLECNLSSENETGLISMSRKTLGPIGEGVAWLFYLLLLYSLISVYIAGATSSIGGLLSVYFSLDPSSLTIMALITGCTISLLVYGVKIIDKLNQALFFGAVVCLVLLISLLAPHISGTNFESGNLAHLPIPMPILVTAFGFHILIPSLVTYLKRDTRLLRFSLFIGSLIPLVVYLVWQTVLMGSLSLHGENGLHTVMKSSDQIANLNSIMMKTTGSSSIYLLSSFFSTFAILTSLLGVSLSLWDFLKDGFSSYNLSCNKLLLIILIFVPPLWLIHYFPQSFTSLLGYAGVAVSILLGLLPIAMCWKGRLQPDWGEAYKAPFGNVALGTCSLFFFLVILIQCFPSIFC